MQTQDLVIKASQEERSSLNREIIQLQLSLQDKENVLQYDLPLNFTLTVVSQAVQEMLIHNLDSHVLSPLRSLKCTI